MLREAIASLSRIHIELLYNCVIFFAIYRIGDKKNSAVSTYKNCIF